MYQALSKNTDSQPCTSPPLGGWCRVLLFFNIFQLIGDSWAALGQLGELQGQTRTILNSTSGEAINTF